MARFWRTAFFAAALALLPRPGAAAPAEIALGDLTLDYDAAAWRITGEGGSFLLDCIAADCAGLSYELDIAAAEHPCDEAKARAAAAARFPFTDRHATNIHLLGELALVLTESRLGFLLDDPGAVFACISRDGMVYRFASRLGEAGPQPYAAGTLRKLLEGLVAPPPRRATLEIGGIVVTYRTDRWHVPGPGGLLTCLPPTCRNWDTQALLDAVPGEEDCFEDVTDEFLWDDDAPRRDIAAGTPQVPIVFQMETYWSGCRNWTPPRHLACAVHAGVTYRLIAPLASGCRGSGLDGVPEAALIELIEGVRALE